MNAHIYTITCLGDSQTDLTAAAQYGIPAYKAWAPILSKRLQSRKCLVKTRVFGVSGNTTAQFIGRATSLFLYDTPKIAIIYGGVNDPGSSHTGTATAGSSNTITLASTASNLLNSYVGNILSITAGTGSGQSKKIVGYTTDKVATIDSNWSTNPDTTSVYSIASPSLNQMQLNHQALIKILKYGVKGMKGDSIVYLRYPSQLPSNGILGARYLIMEDNSSTGGVYGNHSTHNPTIQGDYSNTPQQTVWEYRNPRSGEKGWGRVAIAGTPAFSDGVAKVITVGSNYLNFPSGGDNYNTTTSTGTQFANYIPVRAAAKAATIAEDTLYCDLYDFQSKLIYGGVFQGKNIQPETTQGSGEFHYIPNNQHHSAYGHETVARAIELTLENSDWIKNLK